MPNTASIPIANTAPSGQFPSDEFVCWENVPVFAEHQTISKDGREIRFTADELQMVTDRCNRRIEETGDYAAIVIGHTPDPEALASGQAVMPDLVGFAGPFRLGVLGRGERQRAAILADFHIFKDEVQRARKHPRRSPELWVEEKYEDMFLDPIALLGAEAPRLDMGLLYSAARDGIERLKYSAAAPAAGSTFIPTDDIRSQHEANNDMDGGPDLIRQIVEAMEQLDWVQWCKAQMQAQQNPATVGAGQGLEAAETGGITMPPETPSMADGPAIPTQSPPIEPAALPDVAPAAADTTVPMTAEAPPASPEPGPPASESPPEVPAADEDRENMMRHYAALDEFSDDEIEKYISHRKRRKYEAEGSVESDSADEKPTTASVEPDSPGPMGAGSIEGPGDSEVTGEYQNGNGGKSIGQYARERSHVSKLERSVAELGEKIRYERAARVDAERTQVLEHLRFQGYAIEPEREIDRLKCSKMNDEQFADQVDFITRSVARAPINHVLPYDDSVNLQDPAHDAPGAGAQRTRYSRDLSDRARVICEEKAVRGETVSYETVLEQLQSGREVSA